MIEFVDTKVKENNENMYERMINTFVTKEDLWKTKEELKKDIGDLRIEFKGEIGSLRTELKTEMADLRAELKGDTAGLSTELKGDIARLEIKVSDFKSDIIRWMFALFVTMILAIIGLYFKH